MEKFKETTSCFFFQPSALKSIDHKTGIFLSLHSSINTSAPYAVNNHTKCTSLTQIKRINFASFSVRDLNQTPPIHPKKVVFQLKKKKTQPDIRHNIRAEILSFF